MPPEGHSAYPLSALGLSARPATTVARCDRTSGAAEYDRVADEVPVGMLVPLFVLMLAFGLLLTFLVPFAFAAKALSELSRDGQVLPAFWNMALAGLSFVILMRWCIIQTMAFVARCRQASEPPDRPGPWPLVSILVPAYQEANTIASALRSLIELDYPRYEIIVVDDGSRDDTF